MKTFSFEEIEFVTQNLDKGYPFCAEQLKCSVKQILLLNNKLKLKSKLRSLKRKLEIDINQFLNISTPDVAYFLGIMWADGHVSYKRKYNYVSFSCNLLDFNEIKTIFNSIGKFLFSERPPRKRVPKWSGVAMSTQKDLYNFLKENDYCSKSYSSPNKILSLIPEHLKKFWWRGYFDGDGHAHVEKKGRYGFNLSSSYNQDWHFFLELSKVLDIKYTLSRVISKKNHKCSKIICQNRDGFCKFLGYIYSDYDNIGFSRKYHSYLEGLKLIETNHKNLQKRSQPISYYTKDWKLLGSCSSIEELSRVLGIRSNAIREYFRCNRSHCHNFQFKKDK